MTVCARVFGLRSGPRTRLTIWYTVLLASSMIVLGSVALWVINRELWLNFDEMLRARAGAIESDLQHDVGHFGPEDAHEADALGVNLDIVREWDRNGKLLYGRTGSAPRSGVGCSAAGCPGSRWRRLLRGAPGRWTDGASAQPRRLRSRPTARVRPGGPSDRAGSTTSSNGSGCSGSGPGAALVMAGAGGWFLAGHALGPIDRITRAAERIGADDLSRRLDLRLPDDELGRLAHAFDAMIARLEGAFERQRRFTADASHELRTPLGVIRSQSDVALSRPRTTEYYERVLASIRDETGRLTRLAESLLVLARADDGEALTLASDRLRESRRRGRQPAWRRGLAGLGSLPSSSTSARPSSVTRPG